MRPVECLIVVDMQRAFVEGGGAAPAMQSVLPAVNEQITNARRAGALVVHLQNDGAPGTADEPGGWGWELSIAPLESESVLRKTEDSGFAGTRLNELLRDQQIQVLSVCGVMSEMCVAATARGAMERGYDVVLAHDSHATFPVPPYLPGEPEVPAEHAARVAEWSLGDTVIITPLATDVRFAPRSKS
jgi:nicotinamidase-related amidase